MEKERTYLHHIDYFRGISIIFIVFGHCFNVGIVQIYSNKSILAEIIKNIIPGGTTFFVFISGYLLYYVYFNKFKYIPFIKKKLKYVLLPFVIISTLDIFYYLSCYLFAIINDSNKSIYYLAKLKSYHFINTYLFGHSIIPVGMWYVPFIIFVFLLSPIYFKYVKLNSNIQLKIITISFIISSIINKSFANSIYGIIQNIIYFNPAYLLGIYISINYKELEKKLKGKYIYFLFIALGISVFQTINLTSNFKMTSNFILEKFDLMIIQKSFFSLFFVFLFLKLEKRRLKLFSLLSEYSFGIFFLHGISIWILNAAIYLLQISYISFSLTLFFITAFFILFLSLGITILLKKLLHNYSKYLIGC